MEEVYKSISSLLQRGHHAEEKAKPTDLAKALFGKVVLFGAGRGRRPKWFTARGT